jgi:hypothetical protein
MDRTENTFPNSFIFASRGYRMDRIENTVPKNSRLVYLSIA